MEQDDIDSQENIAGVKKRYLGNATSFLKTGSKIIQKASDFYQNSVTHSNQNGQEKEPTEKGATVEHTMDKRQNKESKNDAENGIIEINTIEQAEDYLTKLQEIASESVSAALNSQLQVLRYVSSPELVNSSINLLFENLKKSITHSETPQQKEQVREHFILMLQNYVFFMNAKLKYVIEGNRKEGEKLFQEAGKQLSKSIISVVQIYMIGIISKTGGSAAAETEKRVPVAVKNLFESTAEIPNIIGKLIGYYQKKKNNEKKQSEFYESVQYIVETLEKRKELIGTSILLSGMITNYAKGLTTHAIHDKEQELLQAEKSPKNYSAKIRIALIVTIAISAVLLVLKWIITSLSNNHAGGATAYWFVVCACLVGVPFLYFGLRYLMAKSKYEKMKKEFTQSYNDTYNNYMRIADEFE